MCRSSVNPAGREREGARGPAVRPSCPQAASQSLGREPGLRYVSPSRSEAARPWDSVNASESSPPHLHAAEIGANETVCEITVSVTGRHPEPWPGSRSSPAGSPSAPPHPAEATPEFSRGEQRREEAGGSELPLKRKGRQGQGNAALPPACAVQVC